MLLVVIQASILVFAAVETEPFACVFGLCRDH